MDTCIIDDLYIKKSKDEIILFIHGIFASYLCFKPLIKMFCNKGYSIYAVNLKGHGKSYKELKNIKYDDWVKQVNQIIKKLTNEYKKVYIISHSLGTLLTLYSENINKVSKAVLLAPALKAKISLKSLKLALISNKKSKDCYIIESQKLLSIKFVRFYHKIYAVKPLIELLKLIKATKKQIKRYKVNSIIVISKKDELVHFSSGQYLYNNISSKQKELIILNKSYHSIYDIDEEKNLYDNIVKFITKN